MHILKWIGLGYLGLSMVLFVVVLLWLLYDDYKLWRDPIARNNSKFGYNLFPNLRWGLSFWNSWGVGWLMAIACLPVINLLVLAFFWGGDFIDWVRS
jgi:hypothetical protein